MQLRRLPISVEMQQKEMDNQLKNPPSPKEENLLWLQPEIPEGRNEPKEEQSISNQQAEDLHVKTVQQTPLFPPLTITEERKITRESKKQQLIIIQ
jgi:hypothetical protein